MDILLKDIEANSRYIIFECPVCGADMHVNEKDGDSLYWTLLSMHRHCDPIYYGGSRLSSGACVVCGCKE